VECLSSLLVSLSVFGPTIGGSATSGTETLSWIAEGEPSDSTQNYKYLIVYYLVKMLVMKRLLSRQDAGYEVNTSFVTPNNSGAKPDIYKGTSHIGRNELEGVALSV